MMIGGIDKRITYPCFKSKQVAPDMFANKPKQIISDGSSFFGSAKDRIYYGNDYFTHNY